MKQKLLKHRSYIYSEMLNALALAPTNVSVFEQTSRQPKSKYLLKQALILRNVQSIVVIPPMISPTNVRSNITSKSQILCT